MSIHHVYINDRPVFFVPLKGAAEVQFGKGFIIVGEEDMTPSGIIREMQSSLPPNGMIYLCADPSSKWKEFCLQFTMLEAAGGIVKNSDGRLLVIFRRGKWDLPKGKLDEGESPQQAAAREVEEECGVSQLKVGSLIKHTYHTYIQDSMAVLKKTYWYAIFTEDVRALIPQAEEDIEKAEWMSPAEIKELVYANTYQSVRDVLECHFSM
jgi:8-oxo-dGTP pyrophosphatase MutT (NUDIX family)